MYFLLSKLALDSVFRPVLPSVDKYLEVFFCQLFDHLMSMTNLADKNSEFVEIKFTSKT